LSAVVGSTFITGIVVLVFVGYWFRHTKTCVMVVVSLWVRFDEHVFPW